MKGATSSSPCPSPSTFAPWELGRMRFDGFREAIQGVVTNGTLQAELVGYINSKKYLQQGTP